MQFIWSFGAFLSQYAVGIVSYARTTIIHGYYIAITFAGSLGRYLNTRPSGLVFKQLPRDSVNVNAGKTLDDPYIVSTLCVYNVNSTLIQRQDNELTLNRRCFNVVYLLGSLSAYVIRHFLVTVHVMCNLIRSI